VHLQNGLVSIYPIKMEKEKWALARKSKEINTKNIKTNFDEVSLNRYFNLSLQGC
jgi:hypothetical protein